MTGSDAMQLLDPRLEEDHQTGMLVFHFKLHNASHEPLYAWTTLNRMSYNQNTQELSLDASLGEVVRRHPRIPRQLKIDGGADAEVDLAIPTSWRRASLGTGLAASPRVQNIGAVRRVRYAISFGPHDFSSVHGTNEQIHSALAADAGLIQGTVNVVR